MALSMHRWSGKVAIVTGASSGIGAAVAEKLVDAGLKVAGIARRCGPIEDLAKKLCNKPGKLYAVKADMSKEEEIVKAFKHVCDNYGPIHILINNAGIMPNNGLSDGDSKIWKEVLDINVFGLCVATKEAIKVMRCNKIDGHIVHINSIAGHVILDLPGMNVYPASKFAVGALAETLRQEFNRKEEKIKITCISPGAVNTSLLGSDKFNIDPHMRETMPLLEPEDIACAIMYALSTPTRVQINDIIITPNGQKY
jgi:NADP+-dependent farnesol dehydrogenase